VIEDLNVAGMLRNRRLARKIADAGFGEIRRQITYKTSWNDSRTVANRWYPSSKTCSKCKVVKAKLPLHVRVFTCDACGLVMDRTRTRPATSPPLQRPAPLVPEWPETRARKRRNLVEPTRRPTPPAAAARPRRGGQVAQTCRTSSRKKRETVVKPKLSRFGDVTDHPVQKVGIADT